MNYVTAHGPLFDGRAEEELTRAVKDIRDQVAKKGEQLVRDTFGSSIRENHGHFMASIKIVDHSQTFTSHSGHKSYTTAVSVDHANEEAVTTDLATYGPWLEGSGSRNESTRFKGYHGFRRAGQELDRQAREIAERAMEPHAEAMNR